MVASGRKKSALKRSRNQEVVGTAVDMISDLPEAVLLHILSFLPAKYTARTSILSRRWQHVWTRVPCLDFNAQYEFRGREAAFVNFVHSVLLQYKGGSIKKFRINCKFCVCPAAVAEIWIRWAIDRNVEELDLCFRFTKLPFRLPQTTFSCKTLVALKLTGFQVSMAFPPSACIPCLKTLELDSVSSPDDEFENKLISCCVVLENLYIRKQCYDVDKSFRIYARQLKCLKIKLQGAYNQNGNGCVIDINAPALEDVDIEDDGSHSVLLANAGTLRKAKIKLKDSNAFKCFSALKYVKSLWLSSFGHTKQACNLVLGVTVYNGNLTHLTLGVRSGWVQLLPHFFRCFPNLEVLRLTKESSFAPCTWGGQSTHAGAGGKLCIDPELPPTSLLSRLRVFDVEEFRETEDELGMLEYILKNGKVLELVQIHYICGSQFARRECTTPKECELELKLTSQEKFRVARKILSFPRASHKCEIKFF